MDGRTGYFNTVSDLYRATWPACLRLFILSSTILTGLGLVLIPFRKEILDILMGVFLPGDWLASFQMANDALFYQLGSVLLFQTVAIACFSAVSIFFFPFRDQISLMAEQQLTGQIIEGRGLRRELVLEAGLVMIAFNAYSATYLLAYFIGQPLFGHIDKLAFLLLMSFFVLDLLSPPQFRRNLNCFHVLESFRHYPLQLLCFGIGFCSPIFALELFLGDLIIDQQNALILAAALIAIITLNCFVCVFALPMGTMLALKSLDKQPNQDVSVRRLTGQRAFFGAQLALMLMLLLFYGSVVSVVSSKVPLKSADYDIQWRTIDYDTGKEGSPPTLRFDMTISNRHESLGLEVENAALLVNLEGRYLGEAGLNIPYVAPNTSIDVPVELKLKLDFSELAGIAFEEFFSFFSGERAAWRDKLQARLMVELPLGLQFPIYIPEGHRHQLQTQ